MTNEGQPESPGMKKSLWKVLLPVAVILILVVGALTLIKSRLGDHSGAPGGQIAVGETLPDFELQRLDGSRLHLSELASSVTLVNFWATWCEACMIEMPSLQKLHESFKNEGLTVAGVTVDEEPLAVVPRITERLNITFPIFTDTDGSLSDLFDVHAIPLTVIIGKDRRILHVETGERDWNDEEVRAWMKEWLAAAKPAA